MISSDGISPIDNRVQPSIPVIIQNRGSTILFILTTGADVIAQSEIIDIGTLAAYR
jgi:hypothetical protein